MSATTASPTRTQLSQIVAIVGGVKTRTEQTITKVYHQVQTPAPFNGIVRTYRPRDDEGEQLPPESTQVQVRVDDAITEVKQALSRLLDVVATQDWANANARADVIVDGVVILDDVPVTYLMWLEKQVAHLRTFVNRLPVLDLAETWLWDEDARAYATPPTETTRTRKVPKNHVVSPATDKHPAQVQVFHEDVVVGYWRTVRYSGATPSSHVFEMNARIETLLEAIRFARERANTVPVLDQDIGTAILDYVFG